MAPIGKARQEGTVCVRQVFSELIVPHEDPFALLIGVASPFERQAAHRFRTAPCFRPSPRTCEPSSTPHQAPLLKHSFAITECPTHRSRFTALISSAERFRSGSFGTSVSISPSQTAFSPSSNPANNPSGLRICPPVSLSFRALLASNVSPWRLLWKWLTSFKWNLTPLRYYPNALGTLLDKGRRQPQIRSNINTSLPM